MLISTKAVGTTSPSIESSQDPSIGNEHSTHYPPMLNSEINLKGFHFKDEIETF